MTNQDRPAVSVVIAVYNDAQAVEELTKRLRATLEARGVSFEVLFIDDGSADDTAARLRKLETDDGRLRVFEFTRNFGQAAALACGLCASRGEMVVTLDGDLQNPPEEVAKLLDALETADIVTARRSVRYEGFVRWLGSRAIHRLARYLTGARIDDFGGNFKGYRRHVVEATKQIWAPGKPWFPLSLWFGYSVVEVPVRHDPRRFGESRYSVPALLRINLDLITSFTTFPLAVVGAMGSACFALGAAGVGWTLLRGGEAGFFGAAALTAFGVGAVLMATGVLGQYLGRIYHRVAGSEPAYVVKAGPRNEA